MRLISLRILLTAEGIIPCNTISDSCTVYQDAFVTSKFNLFFSHSVVSTLCNPKDCSQAPLSVGFPRQESWSGLPFPPPGHLSDPGLKPVAPVSAGRFLTAEPPGFHKFFLLMDGITGVDEHPVTLR